jgi:Homeodomain-like domain
VFGNLVLHFHNVHRRRDGINACFESAGLERAGLIASADELHREVEQLGPRLLGAVRRTAARREIPIVFKPALDLVWAFLGKHPRACGPTVTTSSSLNTSTGPRQGRRARVILLSASGKSCSEIALRLDLSAEAVSRIRRRFRVCLDEARERHHQEPSPNA